MTLPPHSLRPTHHAEYLLSSTPEERGLSDPLPEQAVAPGDTSSILTTCGVAISDTAGDTDLPAIAVSDTERSLAQNAIAESDIDSDKLTGFITKSVSPPGPVDSTIAEMHNVAVSSHLPTIAECDTAYRAAQQPAVAESDMNHSLLINKLRDRDIDTDLDEFYRSKVNYINSQQLAFLNIRPIMYCDFHSFDGTVFRISHPDPNFVARLNATFRSAYYKTLTLWIDTPDFKVEFVIR
jgi:hypothetical protein